MEKNELGKAIEKIRALLDFVEFFREKGKKNGDVTILKQKIIEINAFDVEVPDVMLKIADAYTLFVDFYYSIRKRNNCNNRNNQKTVTKS